MDLRMLAQRAQGQMQANVQAMQQCTRELFAWEEVMAAKDEALQQRKLRRERGEEDEADVREQGNAHYRDGNFQEALECYTRSLALNRCVFGVGRVGCWVKNDEERLSPGIEKHKA